VIADEVMHEGRADEALHEVLGRHRGARRQADAAVLGMLRTMVFSGGNGGLPLVAFLRLGRAHELLGGIVSGYVRRVRRIQAVAA
jgi:hypothetical protein